MTRCATAAALLLIVGLTPAAGARAQEDGGVALERYLEALADARLLARETGTVERLREQVARAEERYFDQRYDAAALLLYEVVESPRFADFRGLPEFQGAELMLATALEKLGALRTASRYLVRILERGPSDNNHFGPAFRKYVDVVLAGGDLARAVETLEALGPDEWPGDARNELRYLRGRAAYDAGELAKAEADLAEITKKSRFYANARYLRGVMEAAAGHLDRAEAHFCAIATTGDQDRYTFYVDDRYFEVKDLAWMALGRVAHEGGRSDDAFYYYFQVPQDSERVARAMFEAAFAMYEGEDHDTAMDLLDQLEARFPGSPFVDEAALLRGYVHLARCDFEKADRLFRRFQARFEPVVKEVGRILSSPARQGRLYEDLVAAERRAREHEDGAAGAAEERDTAWLLMTMLRSDPAFHRLHADIGTLEAEAARAGRLEAEARAIAHRLRGEERPRAAARVEGVTSEVQALEGDIAAARAVAARMTEQLDTMRRAGASAGDLRPLEERLRRIGRRIAEVERELGEQMAEGAEAEPAPAGGSGADLQGLLRRDLRYVHALPGRAAAVRAELVRAANAAALRALRDLKGRLEGELRRARIGRIDAVMGSKRRVEIQIESLAAGRFPPELQDPLRVQGLLRDDEEYWPFEGEHWADEFDEAGPLPEGGP
ncbi:MAG: hypothetical protein ACODAU_03915 [Myxococcota bacterium]